MGVIQYIPDRVIDLNGIADGANVYVYQTGTTTPVSIYDDPDLTNPVTNPLIVGAGAAVPTLYHNEGDDVRLYITDDAGGIIFDQDPYVEYLSRSVMAGDGGAGFVGLNGGGTSQDIADIVEGLTRAQLAARSIPAGVDRLQTVGWAAAGDGGHAWYKRVASEPAHDLKIQSADGAWWEIDEPTIFLEMAGGGADIVDNSAAITRVIDYLPERIMHTVAGSGPRSYHGSNKVCFRTAGPYRFATKIEAPKEKAVYFYDDIPHRVQMHYTGSDKVAILFAPGGAQSAYGVINVDVKGGAVAVVGGANGGITVSGTNLTQSRGKALWFTDAALYHDDDYPAVAVASFTAANPVRVTTSAAHNLSSGDYFGLTDCLGEERVNGKFYAQVISPTEVDLYSNAALSSGVDGTGWLPANLTSGLLTKGYPVSTPAAGWNTVWVDLSDVTIANCLEEGLVVESSTFLLMKNSRLRVNSTGLCGVAVDANGINWSDLEIQGVDVAQAENVADIHIRCRQSPPSFNHFGTVRLGSEDTAAQSAGPDNVPTVYSPPRRRICIGPLDGSPAAQSGSSITFDQLYSFGHNGSSPSTQHMIDENAVINDLSIRDGYLSYTDTHIIKETAKAAGRASGSRKVIGKSFEVQTATVSAAWFSGDGSGWINETTGEVGIVGGEIASGDVTPQGGMGLAGTATITAFQNDRCFTLTINTAASAVSGNNVCQIALSSRFAKTPVPQITPGDAVSTANPLGIQVSGSGSSRVLNLKSGAVLPVSTALKYHITVAEPA